MSDDDFLAAFEACTLPRSEWTHKAHLRVAYLYLRRHGLGEASSRMRAGIQRYNAHNGTPEALDQGYHETLTMAWLRIIDAMIAAHGPDLDAITFIEKHTQLHSRVLLRLFYTSKRILSWEAKREFVEPDLAPLPRALQGNGVSEIRSDQ